MVLGEEILFQKSVRAVGSSEFFKWLSYFEAGWSWFDGPSVHGNEFGVQTSTFHFCKHFDNTFPQSWVFQFPGFDITDKKEILIALETIEILVFKSS